MSKLAWYQIDSFNEARRDRDPAGQLKQALVLDCFYYQKLAHLRDLEVEKENQRLKSLALEDANLAAKIQLLEGENKELDEYIQELNPVTHDLLKENEKKRMFHTEFLKKPENIQQHVDMLAKECEDWLIANKYEPILDTDIKKWDFAEQERQQKLNLTQSEKNAILSTMDVKLKIQLSKQKAKILKSDLNMIEHKQKLLKEDVIDLNQLEKDMVDSLTNCNSISYKQVVETKYYPKRRFIQYEGET